MMKWGLIATLIAATAVPVAANASDIDRMGPAQRLLFDGAKLTQRDQARGEVSRARAIRARGRVYDEVRSAQEGQFVQKHRRSATRPQTKAGKKSR